MRTDRITATRGVAVISVILGTLFSLSAFAQVQIEESQPVIRGPVQQRTNAQAQPEFIPPLSDEETNAQSEFFYQMQLLQQEVQTLRGMVEQLSHEVQQLKQQRMDDYLDLDRRLSELGSGPAGGATRDGAPEAASTNAANTSANTTTVASGNLPASDEEIALYRDAMDLLLQKKDYDGAVQSLNEYLATYPQGTYAPNSQYWLGEIYLLQNDLPQAQRWFGELIQQFPNDRKAGDAKYKLGRVHFQMGDKARAKTLLEEVAASDSQAAPLASNFLRENYP